MTNHLRTDWTEGLFDHRIIRQALLVQIRFPLNVRLMSCPRSRDRNRSGFRSPLGMFRTQLCVFRSQLCVFRSQLCVFRSQACGFRTQLCVSRRLPVGVHQTHVRTTQDIGIRHIKVLQLLRMKIWFERIREEVSVAQCTGLWRSFQSRCGSGKRQPACQAAHEETLWSCGGATVAIPKCCRVHLQKAEKQQSSVSSAK